MSMAILGGGSGLQAPSPPTLPDPDASLERDPVMEQLAQIEEMERNFKEQKQRLLQQLQQQQGLQALGVGVGGGGGPGGGGVRQQSSPNSLAQAGPGMHAGGGGGGSYLPVSTSSGSLPLVPAGMVPMPVESPVYSGTSNDTRTWLCAPR